jgi:hypothetical protein
MADVDVCRQTYYNGFGGITAINNVEWKVKPMQVINPMSDERFDAVCEAGVELVKKLRLVLIANGLASEEAVSVLAMAVGGVIKGTDIEPEQFMRAAYMSFQMWRQEEGIDGIEGLVFDPPHKRPGFIPVARDPSMEN